MKKLVRIALALVAVLVLALVGVYFYRNSLIRSAVETQANSSLGVKTTLGSANLGLFGGTLNLGDLKIGSPAGYTAEQMFTLGDLGLGVNYGELRQDPIHVSKIVIDKPKAVIEYNKETGKFNFQSLMDQMGGGKVPDKKEPGKSSEPVKLIIDELTVKDAQVVVQAPLLPQAITVNVPTVTLKQIGNAEGAKNGAAIKEVIGATMSALAASAANSGALKNFGNIEQMMKDQASAVMGKVSKELNKQIEGLTKNITGEVNKAIGTDVEKLIPGGKDPGKAVEQGINNLLGGGDKRKDEKKK
jgi:uncharacterized protein involved in outer membrane biogenesis